MSRRALVLLVEASDSSIGVYDSQSRREHGRLSLGLWPHEVTVSSDGSTAYVANFGLGDYDITCPGCFCEIQWLSARAPIS